MLVIAAGAMNSSTRALGMTQPPVASDVPKVDLPM
jgi:hypothetical protein